MSTEYPAENANERMRCPSCGAELPSQSVYCNTCGARNERRVRYSLWRVGILTFLTFGLYYYYWMYVSWKHLSEEMPGKEFHPFWHAMSQFVPIYNFVVIYQHFRTIKDVQEREEVESNIIPSLAIVLGILLTFISITSGGIWPDLAVVLGVVLTFISITSGGIWPDLAFELSVALGSIASIGMVTLVLWGQRNLNNYWEGRGARAARSAGTGLGEVIITGVGGIYTALFLIGIVFPPSATISSVYEADSLLPIEVGAHRTGSIDTFYFEADTQVDAYRFPVQVGAEYTVSVDPILPLPWGSDGDPLEAALVALWDSDGTTVLHEENGSTPIVIPWTASSSGTIYVTIESDGLARGNYVLRIAER